MTRSRCKRIPEMGHRRKRKEFEFRHCGFTCGESCDNVLKGKWRPQPYFHGQDGQILWCSVENVEEYPVVSTISFKLEDFLHQHSICAGCGFPGEHVMDAGRCECGIEKLYGAPLASGAELNFVLCVLGDEVTSQFTLLCIENSRSLRQQTRTKYLGVIPKALTRELLDVQKNLCYYCAVELTNQSSTDPTHPNLDHMDPANGTRIDNLVVSCRQCNVEKGPQDAHSFADRKRRQLPREMVLTRIRTWHRIKEWLESESAAKWIDRLPRGIGDE